MRREILLGLSLTALLAACSDDPTLPPPPDPNGPLTPDEETLTAQQLLGKRLFEDTSLSEPAGVACISCHDPAQAYSGDNGSSITGVAAGAAGAYGRRNAPTLRYAAFASPFVIRIENPLPGTFIQTPEGGLLHDGSVANLTDQVGGALLDARELNNPSADAVAAKVAASAYVELFRDVYGEGSLADATVAFKRVEDAIAAYERTARFQPFASRFDAYLRGEATLSAQELDGFRLFQDPGKGNCLACHAGDPATQEPSAWLFTSHGYATLGVPRNPAIPDNQDPAFFDLGLCQAPGIASALPLGFDVNTLCGAFRVPTLRNVALTAPYMHNGAIASLRDAVKFHVTRDTHPELWYSAQGAGHPPDDLPAAYQWYLTVTPPFGGAAGGLSPLDDAELDAIVAFLGTLSDL